MIFRHFNEAQRIVNFILMKEFWARKEPRRRTYEKSLDDAKIYIEMVAESLSQEHALPESIKRDIKLALAHFKRKGISMKSIPMKRLERALKELEHWELGK
jgi:phage-related protein